MFAKKHTYLHRHLIVKSQQDRIESLPTPGATLRAQNGPAIRIVQNESPFCVHCNALFSREGMGMLDPIQSGDNNRGPVYLANASFYGLFLS